ncbi:MAG: D-alanyl-D-alanine carboxypeptidase, partial [Clostridia bacterium]|nr:D-alanyl-D-alanine carboxypeptidase [Clostridia bacterium]
MKMLRKTIPALLLAGIFLLSTGLAAFAQPLESEAPIALTAPSYLLMEADTGTVIFEKNADEQRPVASVTKLMTILLLLERIEAGQLSLTDTVTVSKTAAAATGSTALLDAGASYPVGDLLRATVVASGNDSATALAEHMAGTEQAFVQLMNEKAASMGLQNTVYINCTGLPAQGQHTTARDVAAIARAVCAYPLYFENSSLWLSQIKHPSGRVTDLTNTNRLVRFYQDCDGLKTGSTNEAKYCLAATAQRNGMRLIAVVLGADTSQHRFDDARAMLDYGF